MKYVFLLLLLLMLSEWASGQVVDRYPNIQRPSQTTATIAWRRANNSTGMLYLGNSPSVWFDSMSTAGLDQKHFFDLAGLQENTKYYYQVKSIAPNDTFVSAVEHFFTAPLPLDDHISFLAYGDCGYNNTVQSTVGGLMEQENADFAIVTGDIDQGNGDDYDDIFFGVYKDLLKRECHFTCIGNHDTYHDNAQTYLDAFYLFSNNPANTERYYSFEWGDSKFVCMDANLPYTVGSDQYNWMVDEFRCSDKKWLFVFFHQPPWTNAWSADYYVPFTPYFLYQGDVDMRTDLVPEFEKYKVDFVVNGHSHCYQRGDMNGVQYLVTGGAGSSSLDFNTNSNAPNISVEIYENHFVRFDISGDTAKYVMINDNGQRQDSVVVVKPYQHYNAAISSSDPSCNTGSDGQVLLSISGSKTPYTYLWNTGATSNNISGLTAGTYTVVITDAVGCEHLDTVVVNDPAPISTQIQSSTGNPVVCNSNAISLSTGTSFATYLWSTGATTSSIQATTAGNYAVTAYDALGCAAPAMISVSAENSPSGSSYTHTATGLNATFNTTSPGATYDWDFGDNTTSNNQNPTHSFATSGMYTVQLVVGNACGKDTTVQVLNIGNVSVENIEAIKLLNLTVQPNPFNDFTFLHFDNPKQAEFTLIITDLQGRELRSYTNITTGRLRIEKNELTSGAYLYTLKNKDISATGKLIIE